MFRFNFPNPSEEEQKNKPEANPIESESKSFQSLESPRFISVQDVSLSLKDEQKNFSVLKFGSIEIKSKSSSAIQEGIMANKNLSIIESSQSDILPGKYEGGFKIWECSIDLAYFLWNGKSIKAGQHVLELGCGAGMPGIVAYLSGAIVTFQDFNSEVLKLVTIPNVLANTPVQMRSEISQVCSFLSGDWSSISKDFYSCTKIKRIYDVILTSETIYDLSSQKKLLELMKLVLKPNGIIYLAAKIHYFGVGGGINDFENLVKDDGTFEFFTVQRIKEGVERQIISMKFKENV